MIPVRSQWGRYNLPRLYVFFIYIYIYIYIEVCPRPLTVQNCPPFINHIPKKHNHIGGNSGHFRGSLGSAWEKMWSRWAVQVTKGGVVNATTSLPFRWHCLWLNHLNHFNEHPFVLRHIVGAIRTCLLNLSSTSQKKSKYRCCCWYPLMVGTLEWFWEVWQLTWFCLSEYLCVK